MVKRDEIRNLSKEFMSHRLGVKTKEQTAIYNNLELKEVVLAMIHKKRTVKRAFKYFIRGNYTPEQEQLVVSRVKETYAHYDVMEHEIDQYSTLIGIPSPLLEVALSRASSSVGEPSVRTDRGNARKENTPVTEKEKDKVELTEALRKQTQMLKDHDDVISRVNTEADEAAPSGDINRMSDALRTMQLQLKKYQKQHRENILTTPHIRTDTTNTLPTTPNFTRPPPPLPNPDTGIRRRRAQPVGVGLGEELFDELPPDQLLAFYLSLPIPWNVLPDNQGPVRSAANFRDNLTSRFDGRTENYAHWRKQAMISVHSVKMPLADKTLCLVSLLDTKSSVVLDTLVRGISYSGTSYRCLLENLEHEFGGQQKELDFAAREVFKGGIVNLRSPDSIRTFRMSLRNYGDTLRAYDRRDHEFAENSQFYRDLLLTKFSQNDMETFLGEVVIRQTDVGRVTWMESPDGILCWLDVVQEILAKKQMM